MTAISIPTPSRANSDANTGSRLKAAAPWIAQGLLAAVFLFAGSMKFVMSAQDMTKDIDLPIWFLRFIGVCEVLGGIGLIGPGLLRFRRGLTPLAAMGLVIIMIGATVLTVATMGVVPALFPLVVGSVAALVAYSRRSWFMAA
jgi:uncharacterized membrane protein YphA (DoxX/SURF4 family)